MKRVTCVPPIALVLLVLMVGSVEAREATGPGSFLRYRVNSPRELADVVRKNPKIAARYAKHFGLSSSEIANYFEKNVKLVKLSKPVKTEAWYVNRRGQVVRKTKTLPTGRRVFVAENGEMLIDWNCGNPLKKTLPRKPEKVAQAPPAQPVEKVLPMPPMELMATTTLPVATAPVAVLPTLEAATVAPSAAVGMSMPSIGGLAALSLAAASFVSHSEPAPVPEPSALLSIGALSASVVCAARFRQRSGRRRN